MLEELKVKACTALQELANIENKTKGELNQGAEAL